MSIMSSSFNVVYADASQALPAGDSACAIATVRGCALRLADCMCGAITRAGLTTLDSFIVTAWPQFFFWDPTGFTVDGNSQNFARHRQTELKHGHVSTLAIMGYFILVIIGKLPGYLSPFADLKFADIPNDLATISKMPAAHLGQILAYGCFFRELSPDQSARTKTAAGDFGFKVLTFCDPAEKIKMLSTELSNGRLAMMTIIDMFFQDGLTGSAWEDWALFTASPLCAFVNELDVSCVASIAILEANA